MPRLTGKEVARAAEKPGFVHVRTTGSHMRYKHPGGRMTVIPNHAGQELGPGLLSKILKYDLKITREELIKLT